MTPEKLWNVERGYSDHFVVPELPKLNNETEITPTLPVIQTVNDASDLNSVTSIGPRLTHPLLQEINRIGNIQFLSDRLASPRVPGKFVLNPTVHVNHPISLEVDRIEYLQNYYDQLQRATDNGRGTWGLGTLRHSITLLPNELGDTGDDYLTVHTTLTGAFLYVEIEHTVNQMPRYDVSRFTAGLVDGQRLPTWLSFDTKSGVLISVPPAGGELIHLRFSAELKNGTVYSCQVAIEPDSARIIALE